MNTDIILSGVGGQGILSIATIIGAAAIKEKLYIKQAEVHGMSQRGGDVQSNLRISSDPISSDLIPLGGSHHLARADGGYALSAISEEGRMDHHQHRPIHQHS